MTSRPTCCECRASETNLAVEEEVDRAPRTKGIRHTRHRDRVEIPQRRLQEGYDVQCGAVARPGMDRVFIRGRYCWGDTTPPAGKAAPTGIVIARLSLEVPPTETSA
jgi:hypothetical protein